MKLIPVRGRKHPCIVLYNVNIASDDNEINPRKGTETLSLSVLIHFITSVDNEINPRKGTETFTLSFLKLIIIYHR